jgi:hypothetical protein
VFSNQPAALAAALSEVDAVYNFGTLDYISALYNYSYSKEVALLKHAISRGRQWKGPGNIIA